MFEWDDMVQYLISAGKILDYGDYDESKIYQVARLVNLKSDIMTNKPLSEDEITKAKTIIGVVGLILGYAVLIFIGF